MTFEDATKAVKYFFWTGIFEKFLSTYLINDLEYYVIITGEVTDQFSNIEILLLYLNYVILPPKMTRLEYRRNYLIHFTLVVALLAKL